MKVTDAQCDKALERVWSIQALCNDLQAIAIDIKAKGEMNAADTLRWLEISSQLHKVVTED
jgi:hypothetical protein